MPREQGKHGSVALGGGRTTLEGGAPSVNFQTCYVNRIKLNSNLFTYKGKLDDNKCCFKIDTGSDISILNKKLVKAGKHIIRIRDGSVRYPSGEIVPIEFKVNVKVFLGKYSVEILMYVMEMNDDCLLGADFLKKVNLKNVFGHAFGFPESGGERVFSCSRIQDSSKKFFSRLS